MVRGVKCEVWGHSGSSPSYHVEVLLIKGEMVQVERLEQSRETLVPAVARIACSTNNTVRRRCTILVANVRVLCEPGLVLRSDDAAPVAAFSRVRVGSDRVRVAAVDELGHVLNEPPRLPTRLVVGRHPVEAHPGRLLWRGLVALPLHHDAHHHTKRLVP